MIYPQPESDLNLNPLVLGAEVISNIKKRRKDPIIEDLLQDFLKNDKRRNHRLFFDTLITLFLLGIIDEENYRIKLKNGNN